MNFTQQEREGFAKFGEQLSANPGKAMRLPASLETALRREMAPIEARTHERLLELRKKETLVSRDGWNLRIR